MLSASNCLLCTVDPSKVSGGMVQADLVATNVSPILLGISTAPGTALIVEHAAGNYIYSTYSLSTKMVSHGTKLGVKPTGAAGCTDLHALEGEIGDGTYDLKLLIDCTDGSTGATPAYVTTTGTFTMAPYTSTPISTTIVAWAKNSMSASGISRMDTSREIFLAPPSQVFKLGSASDFVLDPMHPFKQCTMANTLVTAPPPI